MEHNESINGSMRVVMFINANIQTSEDFRIRRILAWLHPEQFMDDGGFQVMQGLYAIGSGGFLGTGLGQSKQKHLFVSEPQNDFIFAIIIEELGILGGLIIIDLFSFLICHHSQKILYC